MKWTTILASGLALGVLATASAEPAPRDDAPQLDAYVRTGETKSCLNTHRIRSTRILNKHQILFEMRSGPDYLNEPDSCSGLTKNRALSYELTNNSVCDLTIVKVLDLNSPLPFAGACNLGKFQELRKREDARAN